MRKQLWLPSFFSSGMILQQQVPNLVRGRSRPGAAVLLSLERHPADGRAVSPLDNQFGRVFEAQAIGADDGGFSFELPPIDGSFDPFILIIEEGTTICRFEDILFGEVWVAAGQSNMQMPLAACLKPDQLTSMANLHHVRILTQSPEGLSGKKSSYGYLPHEDLAGANWVYGDQPEAVSAASAIGFSFARELQLDIRKPVAIIETALRETHIHAWLDRPSADNRPIIRLHIEKLGYYRDEQSWNMTGGRQGASHQPAALFNSKIAPLRGLGIRGIIWNHGESDYQYPDYYQAALRALVADWQQVFRSPGDSGPGFFIVQLKPHFFGHYRFDQLAEFNEMLAAVRHSLKVPTALVPVYDLPLDFDTVTSDWRSPRHPTGKLPIGRNLKTVALGLLYQRKAPQSAPECSDIEIIGSKLMISFSNIGDGLCLAGEGTRLRGFKICGPDRVFLEAEARILYGIKVLVWNEQISTPQAVTYAHADLNQFANLVCRDHIPVVPFRSDRVPSRLGPPLEWLHCEDLQLWCCPRFSHPDQTGWHPAWRIERGAGQLAVEPANKSEGDGSLIFRYKQPDAQEFSLEPVLDYDSQFPPLDLSDYSELTLDIFNPDQHIKHMRLLIAAGQGDAGLEPLSARTAVLPALRWQTIRFSLSDLTDDEKKSVHRLVFLVEDSKGKGSFYMDNIHLLR